MKNLGTIAKVRFPQLRDTEHNFINVEVYYGTGRNPYTITYSDSRQGHFVDGLQNVGAVVGYILGHWQTMFPDGTEVGFEWNEELLKECLKERKIKKELVEELIG